MQWREHSVILSARLFSENGKILNVFNAEYGKCTGLFRGGKNAPQVGDICDITWSGRTLDNLGIFRSETILQSFMNSYNNTVAVFAIDSACTMCCCGMPDKVPHPNLFQALQNLLFSNTDDQWFIRYLIFEMIFLSEVGHGLDLMKCAMTGVTDNLYYISPRTGCAVIREVGEEYRDKLFVMPGILHEIYMKITNKTQEIDIKCIDELLNNNNYDIMSALNITGHFLRMYFCGISNKGLPFSRDCFVMELCKNMKEAI